MTKSSKPEMYLNIYYHSSKPVDGPEYAVFRISGNGLEGLNGSDFAESKDEFEEKILKLKRKNRLLKVENRVPFVDSSISSVASFLETSHPGGFINRYRPLTPQEIPQSIKRFMTPYLFHTSRV